MSNTISDDPVEKAGYELDQALISGDEERIDAACEAFDAACAAKDASNAKNLARIERLGTALCDVPGFLRVVIGQGNSLVVMVSRKDACKRIPEEFDGVAVITKLSN